MFETAESVLHLLGPGVTIFYLPAVEMSDPKPPVGHRDPSPSLRREDFEADSEE